MLRGVLKYSSAVSSIFISVILLIFGESLLISSIFFLGPLISFILFTATFILICFGIAKLYNKSKESGNRIINILHNWIKNKEESLSKKKRVVLRYSEFTGIVFSTLSAGTPVTTVLICLLGYEKKRLYYLIFSINILFFVTWIFIYSSGIQIVRSII